MSQQLLDLLESHAQELSQTTTREQAIQLVQDIGKRFGYNFTKQDVDAALPMLRGVGGFSYGVVFMPSGFHPGGSIGLGEDEDEYEVEERPLDRIRRNLAQIERGDYEGSDW